MATIEEITRMFEQFVNKRTARTFIVQGIASNVDKDNKTFDVKPIDGGANILDVRLLPLTGSGDLGFVIYPKEESNVLIMMISDTEAVLHFAQEIESIKIFVGDSFKLEVKNNGDWIFNDGSNGGLIIVDKLQQQIDKNSQILQAMLQVFTTPVSEAGNGAPSSLQLALQAATSGRQTADLSNITNDKIKH